MRYSTGQRIEVNGVNCTVVVTSISQQPLTVQKDDDGEMYELNEKSIVKPIIQN